MEDMTVDRRVKKTKRQLRQALMHLMTEKPSRSISVRELADRADINRGTFYIHYKDVGDLLQQLAQVQRIEPRVFLGAQKIQQRHHFVHSAVQPCRRSADIVHRLPGLLIGSDPCKVLLQIFAVASDQSQCMEAGLFHIFLRDRLCRQCSRVVLPLLLHTFTPPKSPAQPPF